MTRPDSATQVDPDKVVSRAYGRIAELTLELDKLSVAYEALAAAHARLQQSPAVTEASA